MSQEDYTKEVEALKKGVGRKLKGCFLAGGAITSLFTNRKIRDYDLYFKNKESFLDAVAWMYEDNCWCVSVTPRAITFIEDNETVYQLMSFAWFETSQQIFDKFDFTCCMAAIDLESGEFTRHGDFIRDLAKRELRFNHGTEFPLGSAMRIKKYQSRGYTIEDSEYLKVLLACSFKNVSNWEELKQQVGGQYGEALMLDTSKEFTLDNAVASLNDSLVLKPTNSLFDVAASYEEAVKKVFGEQPLAA
ncbi:hypothetical protein [Zavarzinella formosa]|uniref:hypothetical protein n=1 Tax=Zavarzinella formosa TaxID=360055 RepID=UPI000313B81D|nr:hypothetical protein [Zavarzinella formosa]